ncbi:MAG: ATP-binding protein [Pseudobacter sp.]|uniref:ATP-binding protein n=1 Tax=Pseudobacter sp. TaxID=2045420 RepID=UPI003F820EF7
MNATNTPLKILATILWLLQAVSVHARQKHIIRHFTNENGLPANGIKGLQLDKKNGFLWIGSQAGLVRFDGKYFTSFRNNKDDLTNRRTAALTRNREGAIYFADEYFLVSRINENHPEFLFKDTFFLSPYSSRGGEYTLRPAAEVAERLRHLSSSGFLPPLVLFDDEKGDSSSFSFHHFGNIYHYQAAQKRLLEFPGYQALFRLNKETYFVKSALHMAWYNHSTGKAMPVRVYGLPPNNSWKQKMPRLIWEPGMDAPVIIDYPNIYKLNGKNDSLHLQLVCRDCCPENSHIIAVQIWEEQNRLFLGSETNGLYIVEAPFLQPVRAEPDIEAGKEEYGQAEAVPGTVITSSGLYFTTQGSLVKEAPPLKFRSRNIYKDSNGDCWYHNIDTIVHWYRDGHTVKIPTRTEVNKMVFVEMNGRLYMISELFIADITNNTYKQLFRIPDNPKDLKGFLAPDAAVEYAPGVLAIAGEKLVLFDVNRPQKLDTVHIPGLTTKTRGLLKYGDYLFIGTYGQGLYIYKNGIVKKMPTDKNQYLSYAHCFMTDEQGYCWISTNHGLFKTSMQSLLAAFENDLPEIYYQYFGKEDGIYNTEFNGGCQPCAIRLSNNRFSFPTMNGIAVFDPLQPHTPPPGGQIFIDEVLIDTMLYLVSDSNLQHIPYDARNLRFKLTLPYFGNPENIYFSYKLEPYSSTWETQDLIQNNIIQFGRLQPGDYTLHLRVRNGYKPDDFGISTVRFHISKPWFQTWWFYLFCFMGLIALLTGVVKWRTATIARRKEELQELVALQTQNIESQSRQLEDQLKQLQAQQLRLEEDNNIKARLIGIISHDMISPLKFMGYMGNRLKDAFQDSDAGYHTASFIVNVAKELESLSVNILNWIKFHHQSVKMETEKFNLSKLVAETVEIPATLAREKGLNFEIDVPAHIEMVQNAQAMGVIIYNLSMNAMKYTPAGAVGIRGESTDEEVIITVTDTGPGINPDLLKKLNSMETFVAGYTVGETSRYQFGYVIIKDLLRLVDGTLNVRSTEDSGTTVTLKFRKIAEG